MDRMWDHCAAGPGSVSDMSAVPTFLAVILTPLSQSPFLIDDNILLDMTYLRNKQGGLQLI